MRHRSLIAVGVSLALTAPLADAGNGSNFWHYQNGIDRYFTYSHPPQHGSAVWRCFPGAINHAPTKVVNIFDLNQGYYASKIETIWINVIAAGTTSGLPLPINIPYVAVWSNVGSCALVSAGAGGLNWGLFTALPLKGLFNAPLQENRNATASLLPGALAKPFTAVAVPSLTQFVLGGPLGPNPNTLELNAYIRNLVIPASFPLGTINTIRLDVMKNVPFSPSAITIPEGNTTAVVVADKPGQGPGTGQYFTGSVDDRRVCSAFGNSGMLLATFSSALFDAFQPFVFVGGSPPFLPIEWGIGVSTIDSVVELDINTAGAGPSGLNPGPTYSLPFDSGNNGVISLTGTTVNAPTAGEIFGVSSYDDNNRYMGSNHLTVVNFAGLQIGYPTPILMCPTGGGLYHSPATAVPTGGPGGPMLSTLILQMPRSTGKFDFVSNNLLANPFWTSSTIHGVVPFGLSFPFYPAPAKCGGSTGNNGGAQFAVPPVGTLVGLELAMWQLCLNSTGTAIAKTTNNGHSHTNIVPIGFAP